MGKRAFSAPGKALLVGGYLVLDPQYQSYVVALSSRMHSVVECKPSDQYKIKVVSAQFDNDTWEYHIITDEQGNLIPQEDNQKNNQFVEKTIFNYDITIEIFSDAGFHSKDESIIKENGVRKFNFHKKTITKVPKTGLGSSACLVTVLTSALVSVFMGDKFDVRNESILLLTHNLAQVAHCQAQGKVGSGFDVAAATFGSIFKQMLTIQTELRKLINETDWSFTHKRIQLPKGLRLVMGDVKSGSETTKMVAKVKQCINEGNMKFIEALDTLNKTNDGALVSEIDSGNVTSRVLVDARDAIEQVRENFRIITNEGNVDVEPVVQTQLLDQVLNEKGVLTAMIPGAGGYDAIAIIVSEKCQIQTSANKIFDNVTFLDLKQEDLGILEEQPEDYEALE
ncbi:hypothetical protein ACO0OL_002521 [Hanseniaspora opuntiae]